MTEEMQARALAQWEGYKLVPKLWRAEGDGELIKGMTWQKPDGEVMTRGWASSKWATLEGLPTYTSLDDLHRIEERLTDEERRRFMDELLDPVSNPERRYPWNWCDLDPDDWFALIHASAEQRRISIIRALNLWTESHE